MIAAAARTQLDTRHSVLDTLCAIGSTLLVCASATTQSAVTLVSVCHATCVLVHNRTKPRGGLRQQLSCWSEHVASGRDANDSATAAIGTQALCGHIKLSLLGRSLGDRQPHEARSALFTSSRVASARARCPQPIRALSLRSHRVGHAKRAVKRRTIWFCSACQLCFRSRLDLFKKETKVVLKAGVSIAFCHHVLLL